MNEKPMENPLKRDRADLCHNVFVTKSEITNDFLAKVLGRINQDQKERPVEDLEVLQKIKADLGGIIAGKIPNAAGKHFQIYENEYHFLSQNDPSLWGDYLIFRYKFKIYPDIGKLTDFPTYLLVELVSYCNLRCTMCFQVDKTFTVKSNLGAMDLGLFKKVIDEAVGARCRTLTMASRGEPTLHPQLEEILKYVKGKFFDIKINTNAMVLDEKKCHWILENGVTELVFSVEGVEKEEYERVRVQGKFEQVLENIKRFHRIRNTQYPDSKCKTRVSGVKYSPSFDVPRFINFWKDIVDNVACVEMESRWDTYNNPLTHRTAPCRKLWEGLYVWYDGTVNPCDIDYKSHLAVGNVQNTSIRDIWNGERYNRLRADHSNAKRSCRVPCDRCEY